MSEADLVLLVLVGVSLLVGLLRGFIKEVFALGVWAAAFLVAFYFSGPLSERFAEAVTLPSGRTALAFAAIFIVVLIIGGMINYLLGKLVEKTGLSGTDRLLGAVFGALRGVLLVLVLIILAGFTPVPRDPWWGESRVITSLLPLAEWGSGFLPEAVREYLELRPPAGGEEPDLA
ncbi:MAG: CvpA family protein [Gammaproteobacteria bacterium]